MDTLLAKSIHSTHLDLVDYQKILDENLFQALGDVPPSVPTDPVKTFSKCSARATCHPPRFPIEGPRQT